jgi:hypothetical protein
LDGFRIGDDPLGEGKSICAEHHAAILRLGTRVRLRQSSCARDSTVIDRIRGFSLRGYAEIIVMPTAIIGEADVLCTRDNDSFEDPANEYLGKMGTAVLDDLALIHRLRS